MKRKIKRIKKSTLRQKQALVKVVENGGNVSKGMRDAGYSPSTAKTPQKLTESKGWEQLLEEYFPDSLLLSVNLAGLEALKPSNAAILLTADGKTIKAEDQGLIETIDYQTRHKYLETALKLKARFKESDIKILQQFQEQNKNELPIPIMGDSQLRQQIQNLEKLLREKGVPDNEIRSRRQYNITYAEWVKDDGEKNKNEITFTSFKEDTPQEAEVVTKPIEPVPESKPIQEPQVESSLRNENLTKTHAQEIAPLPQAEKEDVQQAIDKRKQAALHTSPVAYSQPVQQQSAPDTFRIGE